MREVYRYPKKLQRSQVIVHEMKRKIGIVLTICLSTLAASAQNKVCRSMANTVNRKWPKGMMPSLNTPGKWTYEEGVLLDGMTAEWRATGDGRYFLYVKDTLDPHLVGDASGGAPIAGYPAEQHSFDNIKTGQALLTMYRVTQDAKYYRAAKYVRD